MTNNGRAAGLLISCAVLISGCATAPPPQPETTASIQPAPNPEVLKALADIRDVKQELRELRNAVEEMQFEASNANRRQQDLFQDVDRRLVNLERSQQTALAATDPATDPAIDPATGEQTAVINGDSGQQGQASQVVVVDSNNSAASTSTQVQASGDGAKTTIPPGGSVTLAEQEAYDEAFNLLKQSRYEDAVASYQTFVETWPDSALTDDAYYWMSEAQYVNREFEQALSGFRAIATRFPDSQRVPEALLKIGYIQYDIGAYEDAAQTFRDILQQFPGHQVNVAAKTRLRRIEQTIN